MELPVRRDEQNTRAARACLGPTKSTHLSFSDLKRLMRTQADLPLPPLTITRTTQAIRASTHRQCALSLASFVTARHQQLSYADVHTNERVMYGLLYGLEVCFLYAEKKT